MSKAILVIDMPEDCSDCIARAFTRSDRYCAAYPNTLPVDYPTKPDWCPLIPAPKEQEIWYGDDSSDWDKGYNACLHEIVGGQDDD